MWKLFSVHLYIPKVGSCSRDSNRGLFKHFFGEDGKKRMQLTSFDDFLKGLHDEIVRLEYSHYDFKNQVCLLPSQLVKYLFYIAQTACAVATTFLQQLALQAPTSPAGGPYGGTWRSYLYWPEP